MRPWIIATLLIVLAATWGCAWNRNRTYHLPGQPRPRRWPWITTTVTISLVLPLTVMEWQWRSTVTAASEAVVWVTGRPEASVSCQRMSATMIFAGAESGHVMWENGDERGTGSTAWLTYDTCHELGEWLKSDKSAPTIDHVIAVHVLAHEAAHINGTRNEADTECQALAWDTAIAQHLGASDEDAVALAHRYANEVWPHMPAGYRRNCADAPTVTTTQQSLSEQVG